MTAPKDGGTGPAGINRRRAERIAMPATGGPVAVVGARLVDVSPFGMMIESPLPMTPDSVLEFRLVVEGKKTDVSARVAMCVPGRGPERKAYGIGLEFMGIGDDLREEIRDVLARHAASAGG